MTNRSRKSRPSLAGTSHLYDFGKSDLVIRNCDSGQALSAARNFLRNPSTDAGSLHRKLGVHYLLTARLKTSGNVHAQVKHISTGCKAGHTTISQINA